MTQERCFRPAARSSKFTATAARCASGRGRVAGTAARGEALVGDAYLQTQDILGTIRSALEQAGARIQDVVRTVMYVTDIGDADLVGRAHREVFGDIRPASTMVQVSALIRPEMRVEIEAYALNSRGVTAPPEDLVRASRVRQICRGCIVGFALCVQSSMAGSEGTWPYPPAVRRNA